MKILLAGALILAALLSSCASITGHGLVPGQSTAQDVEALMGRPAERLKAADGDTIWFYPHQPYGRMMYAVRVAPDGRVRSVEQVLTEANVGKLVAGVTTRSQVRELFGPPYQTSNFPRQQREAWTYTLYNASQLDYYLHVQFSGDGIVREVILIQDYYKEMGDTKN
jgi:outer membrane protein assembly factor BamE (lipoprotein component of BamABCDE complex)